ncbi:amino acid deaminase, partial [Rhodococcus erythropolis]|nr:amino acid deaminase [Rhodococcus erythropolis]
VSPASRIRVLVELGYDSGRAGARTVEQALDVARAASQAPSLILTGVEGFEGMMPGASVAARRISVDSYLKSARVFTEICVAENLFENNSAKAPRPLVTFGGSAFHDLVVR